MVDTVASTTNNKWDDIFEWPIRTFLNIYSYSVDKANFEKQELDKFKRTHKGGR